MPNIKAWLQLLVAILSAVYAQLTDGGIDTQEWVVVAGIGVGAFGVYVVGNMSSGIAEYAKGVVSFLTAGLSVLYVVIPGGLTTAETIEVLLAGAAAIGLVVGVGERGYRFSRQLPSVRERVDESGL
jgi:hypothetical protein